nr:zinc finger BED domain-containing protein RICESLEEPER 1-like [Lolium perenne]
MLDASILYREDLDEYAQQDPNYKWQPTDQEWTLYGRMQPILKAFAEVTTVLSGSNYPTDNIFYPYIMNVKIVVNTNAVQSNDENLKAMGKAMLDKFDKYWDNTYTENANDSGRNKRKLYGREKGMREAEDIKAEFFDLYATYEVENRQKEAANSNEQSASSRNQATSMSTLSGFQSFLEETNTEPCQSELTCYLEDKTHPMADRNFKIVDWWRLNAHRYPVIAKIARKFLTVPATSVSSESRFSTGGRVLDDYRSSLRPKMVEALVCVASFIKGSKDNCP